MPVLIVQLFIKWKHEKILFVFKKKLKRNEPIENKKKLCIYDNAGNTLNNIYSYISEIENNIFVSNWELLLRS